jgi:hypothetical protein
MAITTPLPFLPSVGFPWNELKGCPRVVTQLLIGLGISAMHSCLSVPSGAFGKKTAVNASTGHMQFLKRQVLQLDQARKYHVLEASFTSIQDGESNADGKQFE